MPWSRAPLVFCAAICLLLLEACGSDSSSFRADDVMFQEQFIPGQAGKWQLEGDDLARAYVQNEKLIIEIDSPQTLQFATLTEPTFTDFTLQVDVTRLTGDLESSAGILFRLQSPVEFYRFEITGNGLFVIQRHDASGHWVNLIEDWQESTAIRQGLNVTNHLKVTAIGTAFAFRVNDQLLLETEDSSFASGKIALDAGTFGRPGVQVTFDNLVVTRP